ncbi:hypothetical protein BH23CHL8_BH23CHL8_31150 [soil metagenome]
MSRVRIAGWGHILMGRRGPAPAPDAAKLARGETRPSRLNGREPLPRAMAPTMPPGMDDRARAVWRGVLRALGPTGIITAADAHVLRAFCEAVSAYERDVSLLARSGPVIQGARGRELVRNPLHQTVRDDRDAMRLLARELGLSPAARANLSVSIGPKAPDISADIGPPPRLRVLGS